MTPFLPHLTHCEVLDSLLSLSDFVPLSFNRLSLESSQRSRDKGRPRAPCQAERTGDRCLSSQGRRQVSGVQNPDHRARSQWTEWMHPGSTQPTASRAWRAMLTNIPTWQEDTLKRCTGSLCTPYSSSSLFHPSFRAVLPVLIETYSGDLTHIVSNSLQPHGLLCPWDSPGKNTGVGCHAILQGNFPTQGSKPHLLCLLHCRWSLYLLTHRESPGSNKTFQENRPYLSFLECTLIFSYPISF